MGTSLSIFDPVSGISTGFHTHECPRHAWGEGVGGRVLTLLVHNSYPHQLSVDTIHCKQIQVAISIYILFFFITKILILYFDKYPSQFLWNQEIHLWIGLSANKEDKTTFI